MGGAWIEDGMYLKKKRKKKAGSKLEEIGVFILEISRRDHARSSIELGLIVLMRTIETIAKEQKVYTYTRLCIVRCKEVGSDNGVL